MRLGSLVSRLAYIFFTGYPETHDVVFKFIIRMVHICEMRNKRGINDEDALKIIIRNKREERKEKREVRRKGKGKENVSKEIMTELLLDYFTELNQLLIFHIRIDFVSLVMNSSRWETLCQSVLGVYRFPCSVKPSLAIKRSEHPIIYSPFTLKFRKMEG